MKQCGEFLRRLAFVSLGFGLVGCGQESTESVSSLGNTSPFKTTILSLFPNPVIKLGFERSETNPDILVPIVRNLLPYQYDVYTEAQLSPDQSTALSLVTGMGIEAGYDTVVEGKPTTLSLPIRMGLRAREWDATTKEFKVETKIFAAQGIDLSNTQEFSLSDPVSPNHVFTGLGMRLREGRFLKVELSRPTFDMFRAGQSVGGSLTAANQIQLPAGWAVVGLIIGIDKINSEMPPREPFVEDIIIFSAQQIKK